MGLLSIPDVMASGLVLLLTLSAGPFAAGFRVGEEFAAPPCPPDKPPVQCVVAPCSITKCPKFPNAKCIDDFCGGCFAKFFLGGNEVTESCHSTQSEDPTSIPPGLCFLKPDPGPCEAATTRYFYNWISRECETFIYGGCLGNGNNFETLEDCEATCGHGQGATILPCPPDKIAPCFTQPCSVTTCPNFPTATCVDDHCGGCLARYFLEKLEVTKHCNCTAANP